MGQQFRNTITGQVITAPAALQERYESKPQWEAVKTVAAGELKGAELDAVLKANGLAITGRADEKRQRLADHLADPTKTIGHVDPDVPNDDDGPVDPAAVITTVPSQD